MTIDAKDYRLANAQETKKWLGERADAYLKILYPLGLPQHLSDEDVAEQLDKSEKRSRAARKANATRKKSVQAEKQEGNE